ncbi:MAG TPA: type IV secretion system DNA-binding domain-containing protein [Stenomitos sp.]
MSQQTPQSSIPPSPQASVSGGLSQDLWHSIGNSSGLALLGCIAFLVIVAQLGNLSKKPRLASGHWGTHKEVRTAQRKAHQQIAGRKRNSVALYVGVKNPKYKVPNRNRRYIPDVQRGVGVVGGPGSGKTFSMIDPMLRSAVEQGLPIILYDFKYPTQCSRIAAYAKMLGYRIDIFAPGFPESQVCNPLDFLRDETDAETARQIAAVLNKNFKLANAGPEDPFFGPAGDQLTEGVFVLAKASPYPDLITCQTILDLDQLGHRIEAADLNPWVKKSFGQFLSVKGSEKTAASIQGTANNNFNRFTKPGLIGAFAGATSLPLDLSGRQMLIIGLDRERRDVVGPLAATILHMIVNRNVSKKRHDPLIVGLDELPTLYLPSLVNWLNENREDGFCGILGFQNMTQLEKAYGKEVARAIITGCSTKAIFNPGEPESARVFSEILGEEEIRYKQKSRSRGKGGGSTSISDQDRTRKLFEPAQFLKLPTGRCILISPGFANKRKKEANIPLNCEIKIAKSELKLVDEMEAGWEAVRNECIRRSTQLVPGEKDLILRRQALEELIPLPLTA